MRSRVREGNWYAGFSPNERSDHLAEQKRRIASGELAPASGPCALCGDPDTRTEYHSEDYAQPYCWTPPAAYALCAYCHRHQLHRRFSRPDEWAAYLAHVRRGGYARDLLNPTIRLEFETYRWSVSRGKSASIIPLSLFPLRPYSKVVGKEWFSGLTVDPRSLRDPAARPRRAEAIEAQ
jgi:hypothetical protein